MSFETATLGRARVAFHFRGRPIAEIAGGDGTDEPTGGTPGAGGTPGQAAAGQQPAAGTTPPATGTNGTGGTPGSSGTQDQPEDVTGLKSALARERELREQQEAAAKAATAELQQLREAGQSEAEKARTQAVREAVAAERATWQAGYREIVAEGALRGAGITSEKMLRLALMAPEFTKLKVTDDRKVEGVAEAVEAFKKDYPEAFGTKPDPGPGGSWGGAEGGRTGKEPGTLEEAVQAHYAKH